MAKQKKNAEKDSAPIAKGLLFGILLGIIIDNLALGIVIGVAVGAVPELKNRFKK